MSRDWGDIGITMRGNRFVKTRRIGQAPALCYTWQHQPERWLENGSHGDSPGMRAKPVSAYSILMPEEYSFSSDVVRKFMKESFDQLLTARDPALSYPADGNRLVQAFCWFSTADPAYQTSNLFDPETRAITPVGKAFKEYIARLK